MRTVIIYVFDPATGKQVLFSPQRFDDEEEARQYFLDALEAGKDAEMYIVGEEDLS